MLVLFADSCKTADLEDDLPSRQPMVSRTSLKFEVITRRFAA